MFPLTLFEHKRDSLWCKAVCAEYEGQFDNLFNTVRGSESGLARRLCSCNKR